MTESNFFLYRVFLRAVTWQRDSHGLFDYESKSILKKSLKTIARGKIIRTGNEIELININKDEKEINPEAQTLLQIKYGKDGKLFEKRSGIKFIRVGGFLLDHSKDCDMQEEDSVDRLWLVIRSLKNPEGKYVLFSHCNLSTIGL